MYLQTCICCYQWETTYAEGSCFGDKGPVYSKTSLSLARRWAKLAQNRGSALLFVPYSGLFWPQAHGEDWEELVLNQSSISKSSETLLAIFLLRFAFSSTTEQDLTTDNKCSQRALAHGSSAENTKRNGSQRDVDVGSSKQVTPALRGCWILFYRWK